MGGGWRGGACSRERDAPACVALASRGALPLFFFFRVHSIARTSDNDIEMHAPAGSALLTLESAALPNPTPSRDCRAAAHLRDGSKSGGELSVYWKIMQTPSEGLQGSRRPEKVKYKWGGNVRSSCRSAEQGGMFGIRKGRSGRTHPEVLLRGPSKQANGPQIPFPI